jgi:hypothetical protein
MAEVLAENDWEVLVTRIKDGTCTPFIGAGASYPSIGLGGTIAKDWSIEIGYPLADNSNLSRVAQYIALNPGGSLTTPKAPKLKMVEYIRGRRHQGADDPEDIYNVLADLPLSVYITTNYDSFMSDALLRKNKKPELKFCRWNRLLDRHEALDPSFEPKPTHPLVFHLHGHMGVADSLVLTEDDYIDFIVNVSQNPARVPTQIQDAMTDNLLLFLGYSLADWDFKVFFRTLQNYLQNSTREGHLSVQVEPDQNTYQPEQKQKITRYLNKYFQAQSIVVYWGPCSQFARDLHQRCR